MFFTIFIVLLILKLTGAVALPWWVVLLPAVVSVVFWCLIVALKVAVEMTK